MLEHTPSYLSSKLFIWFEVSSWLIPWPRSDLSLIFLNFESLWPCSGCYSPWDCSSCLSKGSENFLSGASLLTIERDSLDSYLEDDLGVWNLSLSLLLNSWLCSSRQCLSWFLSYTYSASDPEQAWCSDSLLLQRWSLSLSICSLGSSPSVNLCSNCDDLLLTFLGDGFDNLTSRCSFWLKM